MTVLYYAIGGGLGHLTRARAFLHSLQCDAIILTASPYGLDRRIVGDMPVLQIPADVTAPLTRPSANLSPLLRGEGTRDPSPTCGRGCREAVGEGDHCIRLREEIDRLSPDSIIVDTFPAGLFGELENLAGDYVARDLRWEKYAPSLPQKLPRFERTYILEPLEADHERWIMEHSRQVIRDLVLTDPPCDAVAQTLLSVPSSYVLIVHSGPEGEIAELIAYAREICSLEGVREPIVLAAPAAMRVTDVQCIDVYPATGLAPRAVRIFTGGGYNAMRQFGSDSRHRPLPFSRRFDDQYRRVARHRAAAAPRIVAPQCTSSFDIAAPTSMRRSASSIRTG